MLLGIRQGGKAVDSESIIHWFESSIPNFIKYLVASSILVMLFCYLFAILCNIAVTNVLQYRKQRIEWGKES